MYYRILTLFVVADNLSLLNGGTSPASKKGHQWTPAQPQQKTGGPNWQKQNPVPRSNAPSTQIGWGASPQQGMYRPPFGQPAMPTAMQQPMGVCSVWRYNMYLLYMHGSVHLAN